MKRPLCRLEEIPDGEAKGFDFGPGAEPRDVFLVREGEQVFGYVDSCPHLGTPLAFQPDVYLTEDGSHILCSTHGALFEIDDGRCIADPCVGRHLEPVTLEVAPDGTVTLLT